MNGNNVTGRIRSCIFPGNTPKSYCQSRNSRTLYSYGSIRYGFLYYGILVFIHFQYWELFDQHRCKHRYIDATPTVGQTSKSFNIVYLEISIFFLYNTVLRQYLFRNYQQVLYLYIKSRLLVDREYIYTSILRLCNKYSKTAIWSRLFGDFGMRLGLRCPQHFLELNQIFYRQLRVLR